MNKRELFKMIEKEIEEAAPSKRVDSRNALKKYLGKKVKYQARFIENHGENNSSLIDDVRVAGKSKLIADHLWLNSHYPFEHGDMIEFVGIATNYTDRKGVRKYRLAVIGKVEKI
jgi:hypothetical protein